MSVKNKKRSESLITIKKRAYSYQTEGPYDSIETRSDEESIVTILDVEKVFDRDHNLHKAIAFINNTFAKEKVEEIENSIRIKKREIEELQKESHELSKLLKTPLVPVRIVK